MDLVCMLAQTTTYSADERAAGGIIAAFLALWAAMGIGMLIFWIAMMLLVVAMNVFQIYLHWKILGKAGYSSWLSLLYIIPIGALVINIVLAFSEWPIEKKMLKK